MATRSAPIHPEEAETTPLLDPPTAIDAATLSESEDVPITLHGRSITTLLIGCCVIVFFIDFGAFLAGPPEIEIFEKIICKHYYATVGVGNWEEDPRLCKVTPVQTELALIQGWKGTFGTLPGILLALPFGGLADRIGRKPVFLIGILGCILAEVWVKLVCWFAPMIPLRAVWFSSLWMIIGGGDNTVSSILCVIIGDVCPVEQRTLVFSQVFAAAIVAEALATPVAAALMSYNPWIPFMGSLVILLIVSVILIVTIPETLHLAARKASPNDDDAEVPDEGSRESPPRKSAKDEAAAGWSKLRENMRIIWQNTNIMLILVVFFVSALGRQAVVFLIQYASKRYDWTIAEASFLISIRGFAQLAVLMFILPALTTLLNTTYSISAVKRDKYITQGALFLLVLSFLFIAFAYKPILAVFGLILFSLGSSYAVSARSLVTALTAEETLATVYTAIGAMISLGTLIAGPLLALALSEGMQLGGPWLGLPFIVGALLYLLAFTSICFAKASPKEEADV